VGVAQLQDLIDEATARAGGVAVTLPYDVVLAKSGLDLDDDGSKTAVRDWANQNGYQVENDAVTREVTFTPKS
jgi:hypothetical protein